MKIRNGFVSNSSSSSFMIHNKDITKEQWMMLHSVMRNSGNVSPTGWIVFGTYGSVVGYTSMDNFNMKEFMKKIGIDMSKVIWADDELTEHKGGNNLGSLESEQKKWDIAKSKSKEVIKEMYKDYDEKELCYYVDPEFLKDFDVEEVKKLEDFSVTNPELIIKIEDYALKNKDKKILDKINVDCRNKLLIGYKTLLMFIDYED